MASRALVEGTIEEKGTVSERVVTAVADTKGVDPLDLEPLYETVDSDALDAMYEPDRFGSTRSPERVTFTYCECEVVVSWDESVTVSALDDA